MENLAAPGVINGYTDDTFKSNQTVTRENVLANCPESKRRWKSFMIRFTVSLQTLKRHSNVYRRHV
ncbi:S-layer homology domain-containing protein [Paenibacillus sp. strain BS8-2]